jgi:demethoxyubiquinone hydroxylase (CLK1/Coq7/Cat5 family)
MHLETLDKLLKDELSATETYQQALDTLQEDAAMAESGYLKPIYEDHKDAVTTIQEQIRQLGGTPSEDSGAWGTWAEIVQGGANMLGKEAALKALQAGEKSGAEDYEEALQEGDLPADVRSLIETKLLPAQQSHIRTLDRLLDAAAA